MGRFSQLVLRYKGAVLFVFVMLAVVGALLTLRTSVNYDMVDYLPPGAPSTEGVAIMKQEFGADTPNARVMLTGVTVRETLDYKDRLAAIPGVIAVGWLDDLPGGEQPADAPPEFWDTSPAREHYKDDHALLSVTIETGREEAVVGAIYDLIGAHNAAAGDAVNAATTQHMAVSEVRNALVILIPVILIILLLSTTAWIEPLLFLAAIGVAVLINMGTTAFWGEISFITQTVAPILQLAVSLDYAIFLLHRFQEYRASYEPPQAMRLAMRRALPTVAASAATTVIGFSALLWMRFGIGADLGIHLAKGVVLSFLSVMIFLPALTLAADKLINKTRHKDFRPGFHKVGRRLMKVRIPFLVLALIVVIPCFMAQSNTGFLYGMDGVVESSRAGHDAALIEAKFGRENPLVLLVPRGNPEREALLSDEIATVPRVTGVDSYVTTVGADVPTAYAPEQVVRQFYGVHHTRFILHLDTPAEGEKAFAAVQAVRDAAGRHYESFYLTGPSATLFDMQDIVEVDTGVVNLVAVAGIFIVILLAFRSLTVPAILVFTIKSAIWINLSLAYFTGNTLSFIGYLIISTVQLGATVDYAILLTNHYLADRRVLPKNEAMLKTLTDNLGAVMVSAGILATAGFALAATAGNPIIAELGALLGRGTVLSFGMVVCVLPALLLIFDKVIAKTTLGNGMR